MPLFLIHWMWFKIPFSCFLTTEHVRWDRLYSSLREVKARCNSSTPVWFTRTSWQLWTRPGTLSTSSAPTVETCSDLTVRRSHAHSSSLETATSANSQKWFHPLSLTINLLHLILSQASWKRMESHIAARISTTYLLPSVPAVGSQWGRTTWLQPMAPGIQSASSALWASYFRPHTRLWLTHEPGNKWKRCPHICFICNISTTRLMKTLCLISMLRLKWCK